MLFYAGGGGEGGGGHGRWGFRFAGSTGEYAGELLHGDFVGVLTTTHPPQPPPHQLLLLPINLHAHPPTKPPNLTNRHPLPLLQHPPHHLPKIHPSEFNFLLLTILNFLHKQQKQCIPELVLIWCVHLP